MLVLVCKLLLIFSGLFIAWQDFKTREIYLWLIIGFLFLSLAIFLQVNNLHSAMENTIFFIFYFLFMYLVLLLYFYLRTRKFRLLINTHLGAGDLLVFVAPGMTLSPEIMICFFTVTFMIAVICWLPFRKKWETVPLAGVMALCYLAFLSLQWYDVC